MKSRFNFRKYSEDSPDLLEHFGGVDEVQLHNHYIRHGHREMRGVAEPRQFLTLEGVVLSDAGHVFLAGWCDRRMFARLNISLRIGYMIYDFPDVEAAWYHRDDVSGATGDYNTPSGFVALLKIPAEDFLMAPVMRVLINDQWMWESNAVRYLSSANFMQEALGAVAVLADRPAGTTFEQACILAPEYIDLWKGVLASLKFAKVFESKPGQSCKQSIIITLHRKFDMLMVQLAELAEFLKSCDAEMVIVANEMHAVEQMVMRVTAFCQIHDVSIRIYSCSGNSGFSAANNFGAEQALGETLIFMNPDVFPPEGDEAQALDFLLSDPGDALHGAMLYYGDGMLMHSGMYSVRDVAFDPREGKSHNLLRVEHFGKGLSHRVDDDQEGLKEALVGVREDILLVSAALWKVSKKGFFEMGGLSTDYIIAYYEDSDFCLRWREAGRPVVVDSSSRWIHMEGVGKEKPPSVRSFMWLNRAIYSDRFDDSRFVVDTALDLQLL